jgi:hypothetical protein
LYSAYFELLNLQFLGQSESLDGDQSAARMHAEEGLAKATRLGFQRGIGSALRFLGLASYREGDFKLARTRLEAMLRVWEDLDDQSEIGWSLIVLGGLSRDQGDYSEAPRLLSQCPSTSAHRRCARSRRKCPGRLIGSGIGVGSA